MDVLLYVMFSFLLAAPGDDQPPLAHCDCCHICPPCPPIYVPECQELDGDNARLCGLHDWGEGLVLEWADGITNLFVGLGERYPGEELRIDVWTSRAEYDAGFPPVHSFTPQSEIRPWYGGHSLGPNAMVVTRLVGEVQVVEDVVYAE